MDLLEILRQDVSTLPDGPYVRGLKSVVRHIEAAEAHLSRGRAQPDDAAFTDAIYRCNQAFEGSIKEAYRVLADRDPGRTNIYSVENYLERHRIIRDRVLGQFRNYRTEWRNPSTHDYNLDFDENEALLAVVSVTAFAKLLVDLIKQRLTFVEVQGELEENPPAPPASSASLHEEVAQHILGFSRQFLLPASPRLASEAQIAGALNAYLIAALPEATIQVEVALGGRAARQWADFVVTRGAERIVLEVKRGYRRASVNQAIAQVENYVLLADARSAILYFAEPASAFIAIEGNSEDPKITIIAPE